MTIITLRREDRIMIGDNVEMMISEVRKDWVKLGFIAPREIPISRREMWEKKKASLSQEPPPSPPAKTDNE